VVVTGGLVLAVVLTCSAAAWLVSFWLIEARNRARMLETEARHLRELSQAAAGLAHETRNPLGLVRGWTQRLAQSERSSPEVQQQAETVIEECDRVTARINQFLAFARPRDPKPEAVDPVELIEELASLLEPDLDAKRLRLDRVIEEPVPVMKADPEMLRQTLFNLIQNALQFAPEGGTVTITVKAGRNGGGRIEVADNGPGVPADQVDSLFSPYFTTRPGGAGLGLAIVRHLADAHGWRVEYAPRDGGGSVFSLDQIHG